MNIPPFTYDGYGQLLDSFLEAGIRPVLRHDIDIMPTRDFLRLAKQEEDRSLFSHWFIRDDGPYNPAQTHLRGLWDALYSRGHGLGLHYCLDRARSPEEILLARANLGYAIGHPMLKCAPHRPTLSVNFDPIPLHPSPVVAATQLGAGLPYVSDSCRIWRTPDTPGTSWSLARVFEEKPPAVLLNTHPEWWTTDKDMGRWDFLLHVTGEQLRVNAEWELNAEASGWRHHPTMGT